MPCRRVQFRAFGPATWVMCVALVGCQSRPETSSPMCRAELPATLASTELPTVWRMRRLTPAELTRTFNALIDTVPESLSRLPAEDSDPWATAPAPSSFEVDAYRQIAMEAADAGSRTLLTRWGCDADAACLRAAAGTWIERAQRARLAQNERDAYLALLANDKDPRPALRGLLQLIFQSPRFLYVIERGVSRQDNESARDLNAWELAVRLAYFLWSEPPDDALWKDAESGRLSDPAVLQAHARRLVRDPRAAQTLGRALQKWAAPDLDAVAKAAAVYPEFDPELRASMIEQFVRFASMAIADDSNLAELITTRRAPVDEHLARLLGIDAGAAAPDSAGAGWRVVESAQPRFGVLTLPGVLTSNARSDDSSPVQRGLFIRQNVLCQPVAPRPAGVPALPPVGNSGASFRERFEEHTKNPACAACHQLMDPLGFPFEIYDGLGRTRGNSDAIRTAGKLDGVETPIAFADLRGLVDALVAAPEVSRCWAQQWMLRALGPDGARDEALLDQLSAKTRQGESLTDLIVEIVTSAEFRRVRRPTP